MVNENKKKRKLSSIVKTEDGIPLDEAKSNFTSLKKYKTIEDSGNIKSEEVKNEDDSEEEEEYDGSVFALSEYELLRKKNMEENHEIFKNLNVTEAKQAFAPVRSKFVSNIIKKPTKYKKFVPGPNQPRRMSLRKFVPDPNQPRRMSLRVRKINAEVGLLTSTSEPVVHNRHDYRERKAKEINMIGTTNEKSEIATLQKITKISHENVRVEDIEPVSEDLKKYKNSMQCLQVQHVGKIVPFRICSIAVHPNEEKLIGFVGDKQGALGIWEVGCEDSNHGMIQFEPHSAPINCLKFSQQDYSKLYSCSYDSTLRCCDLNQQKIIQVFGLTDDDETRFNYFASPVNHPNIIYTGTGDGNVLQVDIRSGQLENKYELYRRSIRCIDFHPTQENIFTAASTNGSLATWDVRNTSECISSYQTKRTIASCFFSPRTGNKLLTTSADDYIRVFDVESGGKFNQPVHSIRHDNYVTRWLTPFRATWNPQTDNCFISGSMQRPRQLDMYGCGTGNELCSFSISHPDFVTISSTNTFHPTKNMLFSGNSSGKVFVWL